MALKSKKKFIKTNIKFAPHSESGKLVGFISKINGVWKGVREHSKKPKIIVLIDSDLLPRIEENKVYKCRLVPMEGKLGYVAITATPVQYKATVEAEMTGRTFKVFIKFGNQTLIYDPESNDPKFNDYDEIVKTLQSTYCIKNLGEVIEELRKTINITAAYYV